MLLKKCMARGGPFDPVREVRFVGPVPEWRRCWSWCYGVVGGGRPGRGVRSGGPGGAVLGPSLGSPWFPLAPLGPSGPWGPSGPRSGPFGRLRAGLGGVGLTQNLQKKTL